MPKKEKTIEICRSFSQKVSNPKNRYENMDFFASVKAEVKEADKEKVSEALDIFVQDEVTKSVCAYQLENIPETPTKLTATDFAQARTEAPTEQAKQEQANEIPPEEDKTTEEETTTIPLEEI